MKQRQCEHKDRRRKSCLFRKEKMEERWGRGEGVMYGEKREKEGRGQGVIGKKKGSNGGKWEIMRKEREKEGIGKKG